MTAIDGARLPGSIPNVPGATLTILELESVRTGRTRGELVALAVDAMFSAPVEDPAPPGVVAGPRAGTPSAPTIAPKVLWPVDAFFCTVGLPLGCANDPVWTNSDPDVMPWDGAACCDDHIPDGWVRPDEVPAPTVAEPGLPSFPVIDTPIPHVHLDGGPCVFGDRCGQ